jgi:hypothetical protein
MLLLHLASIPIGKEFNMNLAMGVDLGNAGESHKALASNARWPR